MTLKEVYDFLYDWMHYTLNTRFSLGVQIIIGSQNNPKPETPYVVIHEPPMSNRKVGNTQKVSNYIDDENDSYTDYTNTYECSINIEEVGSDGTILQNLANSIEEDAIRDLWSAKEEISLEDFQAGSANNDLTGNYIEKRYNFEISLLYTEKETILSDIIETVGITERNYIRGG